jgi:hypothetical protein
MDAQGTPAEQGERGRLVLEGMAEVAVAWGTFAIRTTGVGVTRWGDTDTVLVGGVAGAGAGAAGEGVV